MVLIQVDGGDTKGIMPAYWLKALEDILGKKLCDVPSVAMVGGSSTGAVISGALAAGVPANTTYNLYITKVIENFSKEAKHWYAPWTWLKPVWKKNDFYKLLQNEIGDITLKDVKIPVCITAFGLCKNETHFIKSFAKMDQGHKLIDVIAWSALSAAWYFGAIKQPDYQWTSVKPDGTTAPRVGEVFNDGGQGINASTALNMMIEGLVACPPVGTIHLLSLGCGGIDDDISYERASNISYIKQVLKFKDQARAESTPQQVGACQYLSDNKAYSPKVKFHRMNCILTKKESEFGALYKDEYIKYAKAIEHKLPVDIFN